jgi:hypothetical protein
VAWHFSAEGTRLSIAVPANATALCRFPGATMARVTESGLPAEHAPGVGVVSAAPGMVVLQAGAGSYDFQVEAT